MGEFRALDRGTARPADDASQARGLESQPRPLTIKPLDTASTDRRPRKSGALPEV
jgi:hypothetical protein